MDGGYNSWYLSYSPLCIGKWSQKESLIVNNKPNKPVEPDMGMREIITYLLICFNNTVELCLPWDLQGCCYTEVTLLYSQVSMNRNKFGT